MLRFTFATLFCFSITFLFPFDDLDHVSFEGVITDSANHAVANAKITAKHITSNTERNCATNKEGRYRLGSLVPGTYDLQIEATGFQTIKVEKLQVAAGTIVRKDIQLSPAALAEQITAASPLTLGLGKQAFYAQIDLDQPKAYSYAKEVMSLNAMAADAQEGIGAFLEKRTPCWQGK